MAKNTSPRRSAVDVGAYAATILPLPPSEGGGYLASAVELPGCAATGETEAEALEELRDAIRSWVKTAREFGDEVPPPASKHRYSGKFVVRVPTSLHRSLALRAGAEGVSLNQLVSMLLSGRVAGVPAGHDKRKAA
ncbi:MAG: type II toxin-antitoxin system HicB family antitoxin [Alphaproteobacteria bacterium]|nr:type II toxin-antitoxin system HicB family antitoxin [Alphaproteobacteria bacterium]